MNIQKSLTAFVRSFFFNPKTIFLRLWIVAVFVLCGPTTMTNNAATISLFEYGINIDGNTSLPTQGDSLTENVRTVDFDESTGLGSVSVTLTEVGYHFVGAFFDHEIDEAINGFFNEIGAAEGAPVSGQSWEIDETGFSNGDIFLNFTNSNILVGSQLDNGVGTSVFGDTRFPDDVSMAIGWGFSLNPGEVGTIDFRLGLTAPADFHLRHTDSDSDASIFFSSSLNVKEANPIPEPSTIALLMVGLIGLSKLRQELS